MVNVMLDEIRIANQLIHMQQVTHLGNEFPELCDGTIALYLSDFYSCGEIVKNILIEYNKTEKAIKEKLVRV